MTFQHVLIKALWIFPLILLAAIAIVMWRRNLARRFPVFFSYTVLVVVRDSVLFFLPYQSPAYSFVYFLGDALAVLLSLGVIFETLRNIFPPYPFLRIILRSVWILGGIAAVISVLMLVSSNAPTDPDHALQSILMAERAVRFLQVCLLIMVIALMSRLGLTWHQYSLGIVAGFGIYSALDLMTLEFRAHLHFVTQDTFVLVNSAAYNLGAMIWAAYFLPSWARTPVEILPKTNLAELNEAVTDYVDQWYRRS
jgi:hypothetical protein